MFYTDPIIPPACLAFASDEALNASTNHLLYLIREYSLDLEAIVCDGAEINMQRSAYTEAEVIEAFDEIDVQTRNVNAELANLAYLLAAHVREQRARTPLIETTIVGGQ